MSRSSTTVPAASALSSSLLLLMLMLMLMPRTAAAAEIAAANGSCDMKSCVQLEASLLEEYVSGLNASLPPPALGEVGSGNETLTPFGALQSDWSRLLLLQNSQPEGTPLRESLLRLSRLVLAAYFDSQERGDWTDQLLTDHHGRGGGGGAVSEAESEDQQANNATSGSTARKGSARINASSIDVAAYNNGGSQPSGGNFSGYDEDSTTSHYSAAPAGGANFNQTFSGAADNEASGSKSNETPYPVLDDDDSAANEVLHERSREELRRRLGEDDSSASDESLPSLEFNSTKSLEDFFASAEERPGLVDEFFATEAAANETEAPPGEGDLFASSEEDAPLTKSLEEFFAASGELGTTLSSRSVENFFRSGETAGDSSTAPGIPAAASDSGESRKNGDNPTATTAMARLIAGEPGGDRSAMPAMPAGATAAPVAAENRTSDRPDDLFSESTATTQRRPGDDWNSTSGSIEPASDGGDPHITVRQQRSIPQYLYREPSPTAATEAQPVSTTPTRNRHQRRVRRNKRRTRKRAGAELDVEDQYPSFDARELEERSAENSGRSLQ